ncbi:MAG TPA: right-handed parallel beta-helix repeat-containing protein, partial [Gaiellaceae bacterium]|nr:right-handed parallel beta-helix repeat-containing protein [Gaiellaceae bacterium]
EADDITIDGFTIEGSTLSDPCTVSGIWSNPGFSGTNGGFTIVNNIVQDNISGIELDSNCTNPTLVQHNLIQNNTNPGPGSGNGIQTSFGLCNATIDSNTFSGDTSSSMVVEAPGSNINFTNNTLTAGANEGIALFDVSVATISGNTSLGTLSTAVDVAGGDSNISINGNVLANGVRGIQVEDPFGVGPNSGISAHMNCIAGNTTAGLEEDTGGYTPVAPGSLDATNNWWGKSSGPTIASNPGGTGDKIVDQDGVVKYSPFLTSSTGGACPATTTPLVTKTQAMNGDQKVKQGSTLSAGFDFTMPGNHPAATVGFLGSKVTFNATCASGTPGSMTITVNIPNESYTDPANSPAWLPSGDQNSASTYQGSTVVPTFCDPGALVRLQQGGTFSTNVTSTDTKDKVNVRWHYLDVTGGGWSGTYSVVPS